ncbi:MAG: sigma-70 family RNA polymerase sigma factor [Nitrospirota bacterium]
MPDESPLIDALRRGDEAAFAALVERYHGALLRLAMSFVPSRAVAEEVVQETWLGVLEGLARFERRSSLKTWIYRILINRARTRGERERRYVTASPVESEDDAAIDPARFAPDGHWALPPDRWDEGTPEKLLLNSEARKQLDQAIEALPPQQRQVITLRDVEGLSAEEICNILEISETNQRVLLHRARAKVRRALEQYLHSESRRVP